MTDYLAEVLRAGALPEVVKRAERSSTALGRNVEKQGAQAHTLPEQVEGSEAVFHRLHRPVGKAAAMGRIESGAGRVPVPGFTSAPLGALPSGTSAPIRPEERGESFDAERIALALRRDDRRYDSGFFLY